MRKRFKRLKQTLQALNVNLEEKSFSELREEVQAGVLLAQMRYQREEKSDLTGQLGYFFKWYDGPYSPSLEDAHRQLHDYLRFENVMNGSSMEEKDPLVSHAEKIVEHVDVPDNLDRSTWLRMLATIAYLHDVGYDDVEQEIRTVLGSALPEDRFDALFDRASEQLERAGFRVRELEYAY